MSCLVLATMSHFLSFFLLFLLYFNHFRNQALSFTLGNNWKMIYILHYHWWLSSVICSFVGLFSLWHIPFLKITDAHKKLLQRLIFEYTLHSISLFSIAMNNELSPCLKGSFMFKSVTFSLNEIKSPQRIVTSVRLRTGAIQHPWTRN